MARGSLIKPIEVMFCQNCGNKTKPDSKFCEVCGHKVSNIRDKVSAVGTYFTSRTLGCQECGSVAKTKEIKLYKNIGMLIMRRQWIIEGRFCKKCINKYFWNYTLTTLLLGWWGTISFLVTPLYLVNNIARYLTTLSMSDESL